MVINSHPLYRLSYWGICFYKLLTLQAYQLETTSGFNQKSCRS